MNHEWMENQTWDLLLEYEQQLPQVEFYKSFPTAQMISFVGNAMGGKTNGGKPADPDKMFSPYEMLPPYAMSKEIQISLLYGGNFFTPRQARLIGRAVNQKLLTTWAVNLINHYQSLQKMGNAVKPQTMDILDRWGNDAQKDDQAQPEKGSRTNRIKYSNRGFKV